jgi:protein phosphatase
MVDRGQALNVRGNHCHYVYGYFKGYGGIDFQRHRPWLAAMSAAERADFGELYCRLIEAAPPYMLLDEGRLAVAHAGVEEPMLGRLDRRIFDFCLYGELTAGLTYAGYPARRDWATTYQGQPFVAYGHTPTQALEPEIRFNTVNLDQGCCFGGRLTGLRWPELTYEQVNQIKPFD